MWDVEISDGQLDRPYRAVRRLKVRDASAHPNDRLREAAARCGANAVIEVTSAPAFNGETLIVQGIAVLADCVCDEPTTTYAATRRANVVDGVDSGRRCVACNGHVP